MINSEEKYWLVEYDPPACLAENSLPCSGGTTQTFLPEVGG